MRLTANQLLDITQVYLRRYPDEAAGLQLLVDLLQSPGELPVTNRRSFPGHITASAIILSPDQKKVLLIYHKLFDGWYQPGGHCEPDDHDIVATARREAVEETAVIIDRQLIVDRASPTIPLRIDTHPVPVRPAKDEPAHFHHDFQFIFTVTTDGELTHQPAEVANAKWFEFSAPETGNIQKSLDRLRLLNFI